MQSNFSIRALIVDDEKRACTNLENMLANYVTPTLEIAGVAHNTRDAEQLIRSLQPDVVFLDIEMPNENAFHFLERIAPVSFEVIFVTSYNEYAVKAFRLNAVDYILKPISIAELVSATGKLRERIGYMKGMARSGNLYGQLSDEIYNKVCSDKIVLKSTNITEVVDFKSIFYVEALSSYSKIVFTKDRVIKEIVMSNPLSEYEELLPADTFFRIHRSYLINCTLIKKIWKDGANSILLKGDIALPISRRRFNSLLQFLQVNHHYDA